MKKHLLFIASLLGSNAVVNAAELPSEAESSSQLSYIAAQIADNPALLDKLKPYAGHDLSRLSGNSKFIHPY